MVAYSERKPASAFSAEFDKLAEKATQEEVRATDDGGCAVWAHSYPVATCDNDDDAAFTAWCFNHRTEISRALKSTGTDEGLERAAKEAEKFAANYRKAASEDDDRSDRYRDRCGDRADVLYFIAAAIRAIKARGEVG